MAEFGMTHSTSASSFRQEWYTPGAGGYAAYASTNIPSAVPPPPYQQAHAAYGMPSSSSAFGGGNMGAGDPALSFADEPPLLEELGIDLAGIFRKTRAVLLHRLNSHITEELDMGGALVFVFLLGGLHLLTGKLHFGVILGWSVVHSTVLWFLVNQLAGVDAAEAKGIDLYSICCLVGYCFAPLAVNSAVGLVLPRGLASAAFGVVCTLWAAATAAKILVRRCPVLEENRSLIAFPCALLFGAFTMLALY